MGSLVYGPPSGRPFPKQYYHACNQTLSSYIIVFQPKGISLRPYKISIKSITIWEFYHYVTFFVEFKNILCVFFLGFFSFVFKTFLWLDLDIRLRHAYKNILITMKIAFYTFLIKVAIVQCILCIFFSGTDNSLNVNILFLKFNTFKSSVIC